MTSAHPKAVVHPLTGQVYSPTDDGLVEVYDPADGRRGRFDEDAVWLGGDLTYADRQMLGWVGRLSRRMAAPEEL